MAMILREGKTPTGVEVRTILKTCHRPHPRALAQGAHPGSRRQPLRPRPKRWLGARANGVDYIFGFGGNPVLHDMARPSPMKLCCATRDKWAPRSDAAWKRCATAPRAGRAAPHRRPHRGDAARPRHPLRRHLAAGIGQTSLRDRLLRPRPGGELHQAAQGPARLRSHLVPRPAANQFRLILHTGAYWLLHTLRAAAPNGWRGKDGVQYLTPAPDQDRRARRRSSARIRVWLPTACPDAAIFKLLAGRFAAGP